MTMFDFKEDTCLAYDDGTIRGQCPECHKAPLRYKSDNSTSVCCTKCTYGADWVSFSETLELPKLVWVDNGKEQYLKEMNKELLFLDGTCILDEEHGHKGTWSPI